MLLAFSLAGYGIEPAGHNYHPRHGVNIFLDTHEVFEAHMHLGAAGDLDRVVKAVR
jgi:hypothetical protein